MFNPLRSTGPPLKHSPKCSQELHLLYGVSLISILTSLFLFALAVSFSRIAPSLALAATDDIIGQSRAFVNPFFASLYGNNIEIVIFELYFAYIIHNPECSEYMQSTYILMFVNFSAAIHPKWFYYCLNTANLLIK